MAGRKRRMVARHNNWPMRLAALIASVGAFAGCWELVVNNPHPATNAANTSATPVDTYTIPIGKGGNPLPLPTPPHSGTGLSH